MFSSTARSNNCDHCRGGALPVAPGSVRLRAANVLGQALELRPELLDLSLDQLRTLLVV